MDKQTKALILNALKIFISIVLVIASTVSLLGATLIGVARDYLQSEEFHNQIDTANLGIVKFTVDGQKVSVNEYAQNKVGEYLQENMPSLLPIGNWILEKIIPMDLINKTVKKEVYYLVDYFLNSSVKEAEHRIENNITISNNEEFNPENANGLEETLSIYARAFVLQGIENVSGFSTDKLIVLVSEQTVKKLISIAVVMLIVLVIVNLKTIFNNLLYGGAIGLLYGIVIKIAQNKFDEINAGMEDLVGYVFLKPLADTYSSNATTGIIVGIILIVLFIGVYLLFKNFVNKNQEENQ
ncbi:MAG: hypothetical protein IKW45_02970 [Clostridia bacterium]|nr:hypothetical protein [Clostridia bacterium]